MKEPKMKSVQLAAMLSVSEGLVSDMLKYKKGLSNETIRILPEHFKINLQAFARPYKMKTSSKSHLHTACAINAKKKLATV